MCRCCATLGRATAKVHCVSDAGLRHPLVDVNVEDEDHRGDRRPRRRFVADLAESAPSTAG